jgi:hypothetical protein
MVAVASADLRLNPARAKTAPARKWVMASKPIFYHTSNRDLMPEMRDQWLLTFVSRFSQKPIGHICSAMP